MSKTKKIIIMSGLVLLLAVTAVFNFVLAGAASDPGEDVTTANYFTAYRNERNTTRNEELLQLDSMLENTEAGSEAYEEAMALKLQIVGIHQVDRLCGCCRQHRLGFRQRERFRERDGTCVQRLPRDLQHSDGRSGL